MTTNRNLLVTAIVIASGLAIGVSTYAMKGSSNFGTGSEMGNTMKSKFHGFGSGGNLQGMHKGEKGGKGAMMGEGMMGGMGMGGIGGGEQKPMMSEAMHSAIKANDYSAFTKAWNEQQSTITAPTQEQFSQQVKMYTAHQAVEAAVLANNYEAFKKALSAMPKPLDKDGKEITDIKERPTPTAEQFAKMVEMRKAHQTLEAAVLANNYEAFKKALSAMPKPLDKDGKEITSAKERPTPTAEEFAKMVEGKKKQQAIETTLKANDYNAFVATWKANKPTLPTAAEFASIVAKKDDNKGKGKGGMMKGKGRFGGHQESNDSAQ